MKLFLFEFATCGERIEDSTAVEGLAMFKSAFDGFKNYYEITGFVRPEFSCLFTLPVDSMDSMEKYLEKSDAFLIIAPEDDFLLYSLTKKAEKYCENLGSSSRAIAVTSDKWELYKKLRGKVQVPQTSLRPLDCKFIIKPRTACAGEGIGFSDEVPDGHIAQEFIEGINLSVSLAVGEDVKCLSVNEQIINNFRYAGAVVPARISDEVKREVVEEAVRAVECVEGLNGYVGVDIVYSDQPYVIEINARLTTPVVAFSRAYGASVADLLAGGEVKHVRRQMVRKSKSAEKPYVSVGDYTLEIIDLD
ncbi:MAG: hypothetical protein XD40_0755 [Archaeoglobus fulgidus]|uniref:ATP-grasp domain-containing protein n=1 Tax=Archaeoglobus fulgidus TaxID=2234 RepID=A0A117KUH3_ARCFL|nr:ATP-grasp domain-containing protein [Archaeoglobus fulgidus]KUJ94043.1 MAG: hypothetical protein XD40_0755 [Archaeoglobus fulgidus]KUK06608.1 MAG: hypothetical protein XD48_1165 [Archaeoglobus fulgidus]